MKVTVAIDSFKGSLSSLQAGYAAKKGILDVYPELKDCTFKIACDVTNPLCVKDGCSAVYGPQKDATPKIISDMDLWLQHFCRFS